MNPLLLLLLLTLLLGVHGEEAVADPALESAKSAARKSVDGAKAAKDKAVDAAEKKLADEVAKATTQLKAAYQAAIKKAMAKGDLATANRLKTEAENCQKMLLGEPAGDEPGGQAPGGGFMSLDAAGQQRMILELNLALAKANPQCNRGNFVSRDGRRLELQDLVIPDINAFKGLPATFINLNGSKGVVDISPLADMPLEELHMGNLQIRDLAPLKNLPLRRLNIDGNGLVTDLSFLGKAAKLNYLWASRCSQLKDADAIIGMPLEGLYLESSLLEAAPQLGGAPLAEASFRNCVKLRSLAGLTRTHIQRLWLDNTPGLKSLKELKGAPLIELSIGGTCAVPLEDLTGMPLQRLTLDSRADLRSCKGLEALPLNWLNINSCTQLGDISALKGKALQEIHLHRTAVQSLEPLTGMPLTEINISSTRIADLTPIAQCPLRLIHMQDMQLLKSLAPLATMPVNEVRLGNTRTKDMAILNTITTLNRCDWPEWTQGGGKR